MIHYNDKEQFEELKQKGKAYQDGKYDFTFEDRYIIYHVCDVALRYIAIDKNTELATEVKYINSNRKLYTKRTYPRLIANILYSIKYNGDIRYLETVSIKPNEAIDFIFRVVLPYHGYAVREEQIKLSQKMYEGLRDGCISINEAEVGTGKSMAYLVAGFMAKKALKYSDNPVTVATSSIELQKALVEKEIPRLSNMLYTFGLIDQPLTVSLRKGKEHYLCPRRYQNYYNQIAKYKKYQKTIERFEKMEVQDGLVDLDRFDLRPSLKDRICVKSTCFRCELKSSCGYAWYVAQTKSENYDFQVTNHNMYLAYIKRKPNEDNPSKNILCPSNLVILDEAHKFKTAAEDAFGVRFDEESVRDYIKIVKTLKKETVTAKEYKTALDRLMLANDTLFNALREKTQADDYENGNNTLISFNRGLWNLLNSLDTAISDVEALRKPDESVSSSSIDYTKEAISTILSEDDWNHWIETDENNILSFCGSPKEIAKEMYKRIWDTHVSYVLTSGTMSDGTDFEYFKQENGINRLSAHMVRTSTTESPFDYRNHTRLYIPSDMPTPDNQSEEYRKAIADKIIELVKATHGHTAILFTSYSVLQSVYEMTKDVLSDYQLICMTRSNKTAIADFKKSKNAVLFASGAMWEGVDCAGDGLTSVIIARLPFPLRSAVMEQKKNKYASVPEFVKKVAVPEMIIKLRQGVGRLIRNETDTGLVTILDARAYSGANARKVQDVLKKYTRIRSQEDIREFFRNVKSESYFES